MTAVNGESLHVAVTGAAGFIGSHLLKALRDRGHQVVWAADSFSPAYGGDWCRLRAEQVAPGFDIEHVDLCAISPEAIAERIGRADVVVHLAAFAGVRQGEAMPHEYLRNNVISTSSLLTACEQTGPKAVLLASSSSIYGDRGALGACEESNADGSGLKSHYAMTKWINEIQARGFVRRSQIPALALRFFTVFGEWGRPDMAYSKFTRAIVDEAPVTIYGDDGGIRNMTYVDDATEILVRLAEAEVAAAAHTNATFTPYNVASGKPISALTMVNALTTALAKRARVTHVDRPAVDAVATHADLTRLALRIGALPTRDPLERLAKFADWFVEYREYLRA